MKKQILALTMILALDNMAFAAKFHSTKEVDGKLRLITELMKDLADENPTQYDMSVETYIVDQKNPSEKWPNTIKQILYATNPSPEGSVDANLEKRTYKAAAVSFEEVLVAGGLDGEFFDHVADGNETTLFSLIDSIYERIQNDVVDESAVLTISGAINGEFDLAHTFVAFVDTKTGTVVIFRAGYSE